MRVLVVDDEPDVVLGLRTRLGHCGHEVLSAQDAAQATARIARDRPDVVLLDLHMPAGNGFTVLNRMRRDPSTAAIPVVAMTADPSRDVKARWEQLGCHGFLRKPYNPVDLIDLLDRASPSA